MSHLVEDRGADQVREINVRPVVLRNAFTVSIYIDRNSASEEPERATEITCQVLARDGTTVEFSLNAFKFFDREVNLFVFARDLTGDSSEICEKRIGHLHRALCASFEQIQIGCGTIIVGNFVTPIIKLAEKVFDGLQIVLLGLTDWQVTEL